MKIMVTYEVNNCFECPFHSFESEQGFCDDVCSHRDAPLYTSIRDYRYSISPTCPLLKTKEEYTPKHLK